jgi:signal peptidase I
MPSDTTGCEKNDSTVRAVATTVSLSRTAGAKSQGQMNVGATRQIVELLVCLALCVLCVRTFSAEAYVVPTGSMAPTLLGLHRELTCASCRFPYVVGIDEDHTTGTAVCPNCGERGPDDVPIVESGGDRVLVQKFLYDFRPPKRWEVSVFHFPGDPTQAYVKRVVGLPGESLRIKGGDIFVNGKIVRKSLDEVRAMRVLVHDSRFQPRDTKRSPRWEARVGMDGDALKSGWNINAGQFAHTAGRREPPPAADWLIYRHWDPALGRYGPVRDFNSYNGGELTAENEVADIAIEARLCVSESVDVMLLDLRSGADDFVVRIPVGRRGTIELSRNGQGVALKNRWNPFDDAALWPRTVELEAAVVDHRVQVAVNDRLLFEPYDYDDPAPVGRASDSPVALGVRGGGLEVNEFRVYRDTYYTSALANTPRRSQATKSEVVLGADEYFVLGDNSPVSNDSRFWDEGPVVRGVMFVGRPFLVHLPGQLIPLKVFGRSVCWVPDPRRIRYIR